MSRVFQQGVFDYKQTGEDIENNSIYVLDPISDTIGRRRIVDMSHRNGMRKQTRSN